MTPANALRLATRALGGAGRALRRQAAERWLLAGAALALLAGAFDPKWPAERDRFRHVVVFDITQSMNVMDETLAGRPASRLAYAKQRLRDALLELPCGSKVGWGIFTEYRSFLLFAPVEVCENLSELRATLDGIDGRMAWTGNSEIAKGLMSGIAIARALAEQPTLVFVSDGHEAPPLNPRHRPRFDGRPGEIAGLVVGVGQVLPSPIPKTDPQGRPLGWWGADEVAQDDAGSQRRGGSLAGEQMVEEGGTVAPLPGATPGSEHLSALHEPYLRLLAAETGLGYHRLETADGLAAALTSPVYARPTPVRAEGRMPLAAIALLLLVARHALPLARRLRRLPARR